MTSLIRYMGDAVDELRIFFSKKRKIAVAFSGGVDSSFILYFAKQCNADITAYYVSTEFQPQFELDNAMFICSLLNVDLVILEHSVINNEMIVRNGQDRCYHCKKCILSKISEASRSDGCDIIIDGTNASDPENDRPGMKALKEFGILSPLRSCGFTKTMIRRSSKKAGLPIWNLPSYSCLATRIHENNIITAEDLDRVDRAETFLRFLGFTDIRVRIPSPGHALIQVTFEEHKKAEELMPSIESTLSREFNDVTLDPTPRISS